MDAVPPLNDDGRLHHDRNVHANAEAAEDALNGDRVPLPQQAQLTAVGVVLGPAARHAARAPNAPHLPVLKLTEPHL